MEPWRNSEFVVSYSASPRRLKGSSCPMGTFHRSTCRTLSSERRAEAWSPSEVHAYSLEQFMALADRFGSGNVYKVCRICLPDLVVSGRNMMQRK